MDDSNGPPVVHTQQLQYIHTILYGQTNEPCSGWDGREAGWDGLRPGGTGVSPVAPALPAQATAASADSYSLPNLTLTQRLTPASCIVIP
jgi:hypothetical protein